MSERTDADRLAKRLLDEPDADPDDDLRMLSRQLLRRREVITRLEKRVASQCNGTLDLINANREAILRVHEEGLRRIRLVLNDARKIEAIIHAVNLFHPMHEESWSGWPE